MKTYKIEFYENAHKYATIVNAHTIEQAYINAEIILGIPVGNITCIKEV